MTTLPGWWWSIPAMVVALILWIYVGRDIGVWWRKRRGGDRGR